MAKNIVRVETARIQKLKKESLNSKPCLKTNLNDSLNLAPRNPYKFSPRDS
jgi:hypothetical protein